MFSWSSGTRQQRRPSSAYPAQQRVAQTVEGSIRPPEYTRTQHIESYLNDPTLQRSTRKVSQDDSTYDTVFQTTAGDALILRVHFVSGTPAMTLVGVRATHSWLDTRMRVVGFPQIHSDQSWQNSRMLLGAAVHEVVKHFQLHPPQILEITDAGLKKLQTNMSSSNNSARVVSSSRAEQQQDAPPDYESIFKVPDMPDIPTRFDFSKMSTDEMQQLLDDELDFLTYCSKLPAYKKLQELGSSVLEENVAVAKTNLEEEARMKELHEKVTSLQSSLKKKMEAFEKLEKEQNKLCAPPDRRKILKQLQKAKKQAMEESDAYAEEWVEKGDGASIEDFIGEFMEKRKLHHVRAAKLERLQKQKDVS